MIDHIHFPIVTFVLRVYGQDRIEALRKAEPYTKKSINNS